MACSTLPVSLLWCNIIVAFHAKCTRTLKKMGKKGNQKGEKDIEIFERCKNLRYEGKLMSDFWKFFKDAIFLQIPLSNNIFFLFFFS